MADRLFLSLDLSLNETTVLQLIAYGHSNHDVAADQGVSEATVKTYVSRLLDRLDAGGAVRAQA